MRIELIRRPAGFTGDIADLPTRDELGDEFDLADLIGGTGPRVEAPADADPIGPLAWTGWSRERRDLVADEYAADRDMF